MTAHQTALILFAVAVGVVIAIASVITLERINTREVSNGARPVTVGLGKPHRANQY
jgi:hypothetical protein